MEGQEVDYMTDSSSASEHEFQVHSLEWERIRYLYMYIPGTSLCTCR